MGKPTAAQFDAVSLAVRYGELRRWKYGRTWTTPFGGREFRWGTTITPCIESGWLAYADTREDRALITDAGRAIIQRAEDNA